MNPALSLEMIKYFALKWKYFHLITKLFLFKILQPLTGGNSLSLKFELEFPAQLALHFIIITESSDLVEYQNKSHRIRKNTSH